MKSKFQWFIIWIENSFLGQVETWSFFILWQRMINFFTDATFIWIASLNIEKIYGFSPFDNEFITFIFIILQGRFSSSIFLYFAAVNSDWMTWPIKNPICAIFMINQARKQCLKSWSLAIGYSSQGNLSHWISKSNLSIDNLNFENQVWLVHSFDERNLVRSSQKEMVSLAEMFQLTASVLEIELLQPNEKQCYILRSIFSRRQKKDQSSDREYRQAWRRLFLRTLGWWNEPFRTAEKWNKKKKKLFDQTVCFIFLFFYLTRQNFAQTFLNLSTTFWSNEKINCGDV